MNIYSVWHDEYKGDDVINDYWHGIYLLPDKISEKFFSDLKVIRDEFGIPYNRDVKFSGSLKTDKRQRFLRQNLLLFLHSLTVREDKALNELRNIDRGRLYREEYTPFLILEGVYGCKFILMKIPGNHAGMNRFNLSYADRVERTFNFAFKSGAHGLFNEDVLFSKFYFDGYKHHGRKIDIDTILRGTWREHVYFSKEIEVDDRQIVDRNDETKLMMNFVDNVIGALTFKITQNKADCAGTLSILDELLGRVQTNKIILNKNSRWHRSVSFSQMFVSNGEIEFQDIFHYSGQGTLGF